MKKILISIFFLLIFTFGISNNTNILANTWWSHNISKQTEDFYNGLFRNIEE